VDDPTAEESSQPDHPGAARAAELIGTVISQRYRIDALLAMGGMGAVYRGSHLLLKKRVAVKVLHPETENLPELVARFEREAIAGAHVAHANVAAATDFGQLEDGSFFLVLEYVSGKTLHEIIAKGPIPAARAVHIGRQLAAGMAAIHAMGIVHRDVKPRNVMLVEGKNDLAKLIDFGLAKVPVDRVVANQSIRPPAASLHDGGGNLLLKAPRRPRFDSLLDSKPRITGVGMILGTVAYMAPEAALGMDAVDARADLYGLGLMIYEMVTGRRPFEAERDAALFVQHRFKPPPPFAERAPGVYVPPALEAVVMKLLAKDPAARYQTAASVIEALDDALGAALPGQEPEIPLTPRWYLPVGVGAASVLVGVVAALAFNSSVVGPRAVGTAHPESPVAASAAPSQAAGPGTLAPASAAPPAPVPPPPAVHSSAAAPPAEAGTQRAALLRAMRVRDYHGGEAAFFELVERDPGGLRSPDISLAVRDLAVALERDPGGDRILDALSTRCGPEGLDVLYDLVSTRGRAAAAVRAGEMLKKPEVMARATPTLRIAFELREAPCVDKLGLLDRAVAEGDSRALVVLETQGAACFRKNNKALLAAIAALRSRIRRGP
jgi:eukaryotic-like serine/threonine-protein kinase